MSVSGCGTWERKGSAFTSFQGAFAFWRRGVHTSAGCGRCLRHPTGEMCSRTMRPLDTDAADGGNNGPQTAAKACSNIPDDTTKGVASASNSKRVQARSKPRVHTHGVAHEWGRADGAVR